VNTTVSTLISSFEAKASAEKIIASSPARIVLESSLASLFPSANISNSPSPRTVITLLPIEEVEVILTVSPSSSSN
jgi:hypothetical protein